MDEGRAGVKVGEHSFSLTRWLLLHVFCYTQLGNGAQAVVPPPGGVSCQTEVMGFQSQVPFLPLSLHLQMLGRPVPTQNCGQGL